MRLHGIRMDSSGTREHKQKKEADGSLLEGLGWEIIEVKLLAVPIMGLCLARMKHVQNGSGLVLQTLLAAK